MQIIKIRKVGEVVICIYIIADPKRQESEKFL